MTSKNSNADFQGLTTHEDMETKLRNMCISALDTMIDDDVKNPNAKFMKEVNCKNAGHKRFRLRDENLNSTTSIEKNA